MTPYIWLNSAIWAWISASPLVIGAFVAATDRFDHKGIARFMAIGTGALLGFLAFEITQTAIVEAGPMPAVIALLAGAVCFCSANWVLARRGARHRKRCGMCVEQPSERQVPGSGTAIAVGTIMDSVPEGLALGFSVAHQGAPSVPTILSFILVNFPGGLSATSGMRKAGRSKVFVYTLWIAAVLLTSVAAIAGSLMLTSLPTGVRGIFSAVAAGLLLAMAVETAIPEAFDHSPDLSGVLFVVGFAILALAVGT